MTRRRQKADEALDRIGDLLADAPRGLHELRPIDEIAADLKAGAAAAKAGAAAAAGSESTSAEGAAVEVPVQLAEIYVAAGAGTLFRNTLELFPPHLLRADRQLGVLFGTCYGDELWLDSRGRVRRVDPALDQVILEASTIDRWLWGALEGHAHLVDHLGEYAHDAFDEAGELTEDCALRILTAQLRRDPYAVGPRLRRASLMARTSPVLARAELEEVVHIEPTLAWGWLELAKISEGKGELAGAVEEARVGAEAAEAARHPQLGTFWAQVARLCAAAADEPGRAAAAAKVCALAPDFRSTHLAGAAAQLAADEVAAAGRLCELLLAVWPADPEVLELRGRVTQRTEQLAVRESDESTPQSTVREPDESTPQDTVREPDESSSQIIASGNRTNESPPRHRPKTGQ